MDKELFHWIDLHKDEYVSELQTLLRQPSIATTNTGMKECAEMTLKIMNDAGIDSHIYQTKGFPVIVGKVNGKSDNTVLIYGHYDVQPPDPVGLWDYDPFGAEIDDGKIYARGSIDDKGNFMTAVHAVKTYHDKGLDLPLNIIFLIEGEEEIGSPSLADFMENHTDILQADALINFDDCVQPDGKTGRPKVVTGEKGNFYIEMTCSINREFHSMMAPIIVNPAWRLVWALSTIKDQNERITIDNFYDTLVENTPEEHRLVEQMTEYWDENAWKNASGQKEYLCGARGADALKRLYFEPTANICGFRSGYIGDGEKTIIPEDAAVKIDFRMVPGQSGEQIMKLLRAHLDKRGFSDIQIKALGEALPPYRTSVNQPAALALRQAIREGFEIDPSVMVTYPGSGPASAFDRILGIPQVFTGFGPLGDRLHSPNEYMTIDFYIKGIKTVITFLDLFGRTKLDHEPGSDK